MLSMISILVITVPVKFSGPNRQVEPVMELSDGGLNFAQINLVRAKMGLDTNATNRGSIVDQITNKICVPLRKSCN